MSWAVRSQSFSHKGTVRCVRPVEKGYIKMKKKAIWSFASAVVISSVLVAPAHGATRVLTEEERAFATAVGSGTYAYEVTERMSNEMGTFDMPLGEAWRPAGSDAEHEAATYIKQEMQRIGLQNVKKESFPVHGYTFNGASVKIAGSSEEMLATGFGGIPGTSAEGLTAQAVYVGLGTAADYEGKDVTGKIVLVDMDPEEMNWLHIPHYEAERRGAVGLIVHWIGYQNMEGSVVTFDSMSRPTVPAVGVSHENFESVRTAAESGSSVTMICDATVDMNATSYNVVGYIPGTTYPDQYIIVGAHYDKWWYGAADDSGGIGQVLAIAKAMIDSGYRPAHTMVFVANGAEEFGWTDTNFDWAIGSYAHIKRHHPDWPGKTLAYFNLDEGSGIIGQKTISAGGTPELYNFRQSMLPALDHYFSKTAPWSAYYQPSSASYVLPTTWADEFSFGSAGIPTMNVIATGADMTLDDGYHTQMDSMEYISAEALALSAIANGALMMRLDGSNVLPFNFETIGDDLDGTVKRAVLRAEDIDPQSFNAALRDFKDAAHDLWVKIQASGNPAGKDTANTLILSAEKKLGSELITVGGYDEVLYPHEHYQNDAPALRKAVEALEAGNARKAMRSLQNVYGMYEGVQVSRPVYKEMVIRRHDPDRTDLFWATGRLARFSDVYDEYFDILDDEDYSNDIEALGRKHEQAKNRLSRSIESETATLTQATALLRAAEHALR